MPGKNFTSKCIVTRRGKLANDIQDLEKDLRRVMEPNTLSLLHGSERNFLNDLVSIARRMNVSRLLLLSATRTASYLQVGMIPRGPTLTMKVHKYVLVRHVVASQSRPRYPHNAFDDAPLVFTNDFGCENHLQLAKATIRHLFPSFDDQQSMLSRRVVLFNFDQGTGTISFRHYATYIYSKALPSAIPMVVKSTLPDIGLLTDITELIQLSEHCAVSEQQDRLHNMGLRDVAKERSIIKLCELGPRMELEIVKEEAGLCSGEVLYHAFIKRNKNEAEAIKTFIIKRKQ